MTYDAPRDISKVKVFHTQNADDLETEVNGFLEELHEDTNVVKILNTKVVKENVAYVIYLHRGK